MKPYLTLTKTERRDRYGLAVLRLALHAPNLGEKFVEVNSGNAAHQIFRAHDDPGAHPGSLEPIPEGRYQVSLPIYRPPNEYWPAGIGDRTMPLTPLDFLVGGRGAFEIHPDANRLSAPGSAGCPCTDGTKDWGRIAYWVKELGADVLYVDWGLGVVELPDEFAPPATLEPEQLSVTYDIWLNENGLVLDLDGPLPAGQHKLFSEGSWKGKAVAR